MLYSWHARIKWTAFRVSCYICIAFTAFTGGLFLYLAAPYASYIFFNDRAFWKYRKYFLKLIGQLYRLLRLWLCDPQFRGMYVQPLAAPPSTGPDRARVRLSAQWELDADDCGDCANCCPKCPLLDDAQRKCLIYNSIYWRYFSCGRFPVSQKQIDYYKCPKWEMKENRTAERGVFQNAAL